ncbi:leucine-rich repeat domain-containing protein [Capnocytophaga canimorsus]|uniref:leucine-rich repeat domain-containing protein n=1 Tax=Capnocytophaga canimorsus TaxID=28188 RepID=UPI00384FD065
MKNCLKFTTLLLFVAFFGACTKDKEEKGSIPSDHYVLSPDGKILLKWTNPSTVEIDFQADEQLSKVTKIVEGAFAESERLERVNLFNVTSIEGLAFVGCKFLNSIVMPKVTSIGTAAFSGCTSLSSIQIPNGVTSIGEYAFEGCTSLSSVQIPNGVTRIEHGTFRDCTSLSSVQIPNGVKIIETEAFSGCTSLSSVQIPNGVKIIRGDAFSGCTSLIRFVITAETPPDCCSYIFGDSPNVNLNIYVPNGSVEIYKTSSPWSFYKEKIKPI